MTTNDNALRHLEIFVEEESMEAFLNLVLPKTVEGTFEIRRFEGKPDLLKSLPSRLRGYSKWMPPGYRIVVIVDRDQDDCHTLKSEIESIISESGLVLSRVLSQQAWTGR